MSIYDDMRDIADVQAARLPDDLVVAIRTARRLGFDVVVVFDEEDDGSEVVSFGAC